MNWNSCGWLVLVNFVLASPAPGQIVDVRIGDETVYDDPVTCREHTSIGQVSVDCGVAGDIISKGFASNTDGILKSASILGVDTYGDYLLRDMYSTATWRNTLLFDGPVPHTTVFTFAVNGWLDAVRGAPGNALGLNASINFSPWAGAQSQRLDRVVDVYGETVVRQRVDPFTHYFRMAISSAEYGWDNSVAFGASLFTTAFLNLRPDPNDGVLLYGGIAEANFTNSAGLAGLAFFDESGNDISTATSYRFEADQQLYVPPVTNVVPEPSTWLLLATGLAGLVTIALRRRGDHLEA